MKRNVLIGLTLILLMLNSCFEMNSSSSSTIDMQQALTRTNIMPIAVIGSGPAGLMAAIYGARGGKHTYLIEGNKPGGLLMDTTHVENWPGEVSIQGPTIIEKLRAQAQHQGVHFIEDSVEAVNFDSWPYTLYTENGDEFTALSIVIATGASPRRLGVPGEDTYWGSGVTSCAVCDAPFFKDEEVVVVGGGDSAIEEAIQLTPYAKKITILVRKDHLRAAASMQNRLKNYSTISVQYNTEVRSIIGNDIEVTSVQLYNNKTKRTVDFPTSGVFLAIGHNPNSLVFKNAVATNDAGYILVKDHTQHSSVLGVFAAGDVQDDRYRQAGSSAGDGTNAGLDAVQFLDEHGYTPAFAHQLRARLYGDLHEQEMPAKSIDFTPEGLVEIADKYELDTVLDKKGVAVLNFWDQDCPSCKQMMPIFRAVANDYGAKVSFATVNVLEATDVVESLFVHKVPCLLVFRDGSLVARYSNNMSRKELSTFLDQFISD